MTNELSIPSKTKSEASTPVTGSSNSTNHTNCCGLEVLVDAGKCLAIRVMTGDDTSMSTAEPLEVAVTVSPSLASEGCPDPVLRAYPDKTNWTRPGNDSGVTSYVAVMTFSMPLFWAAEKTNGIASSFRKIWRFPPLAYSPGTDALIMTLSPGAAMLEAMGLVERIVTLFRMKSLTLEER